MQRVSDKYKYIYGPVSSWRLGRSLGIDPISRKEKICTFDCVYCQENKTEIFTDKRAIFVPTEEIIKEIESLPYIKIDYITFSGRGEATLAKNLGEMIKEIKKIRREKIAVITNASLIDRSDVQVDLQLADFVILKLDAHNKECFNAIDKPMKGIEFDKILKGIRKFRNVYKGKKLALQMMFINVNKIYAKEMANLVKEIKPDGVQINTPLRPSGVKPLSKKDMDEIKKFFDGIKIDYVYSLEKYKINHRGHRDH